MNGWRSRLLLGLLFYSVGWAHDTIAYPWPNTREWMLAYHGSAALCDYALLACAGALLKGRLAVEMQALCWLCIFTNAFGYFAYRYYWPATPYNTVMASLVYLQFLRLIILDRHDYDTLRNRLLRGALGSWTQQNFRKGSA